ncbi:MAG: amino acid ABC transporter permease, partial [Prevotella sp.]|nr:amino acid ABC transporter permease [Prevotella sp.]
EREQVAGSTIYAAIQSHLGKAGDVPLSDDEWQQLHQTVNAIYPNFREKLTSLTPMNNFEYQVCLLLKIGVKPSDIASLTAHSRESVTASRRRLYEKAMKKSGKPSDWDALVTIL